MKKSDNRIGILFLLVIISFIIFLICLFSGNANSDYYSYEESMRSSLMTFGSLFVFIVLFITWFIISSTTMKKEKENWMEISFNKNNIEQDKIKFLLKKSSEDFINKQLLYTNDKRLFYLELNKRIKEIELNNILKIDVECVSKEKNQKRIIALTTTYDNIKSIVEVNLKIITEDEIYNIKLDTSKESIDKVNQFKLILDRELELLNK